MSKKQKKYSAEFKAKVVLELLSGDQTIGQICSKYSLISKSLLNWKKTLLSNASLAFNIDSAVSGFKTEIESKEKEVNELHRQLGKRTAELEWASKKLKSLDFNQKKDLIQSELDGISILRQCELFGYNRSTYYYEKVEFCPKKMNLLKAIDYVYTEAPFYGYRKIYRQLIEDGHSIGVNRVRNYMNELGLKTIYPTKKVRTTIGNPEHKKYPYLLRGMKINRANQVWSTDITYGVPGAQGEYGCLNEPQIYLKYPVRAQGIMVH